MRAPDRSAAGMQITTASDDPSGTVQAVQPRGAEKRHHQFDASATDAIGWLSTADAAYTRAIALVHDARTLVVEGLNTRARGPSAPTPLADRVDAIRASLVEVANTTYNGRPVFAANTAGSAPYDAAGTCIGDPRSVSGTVGDKVTVQLNQHGPQVFGSGPTNLFALLSDISNGLRSGSPPLSANLDALDDALSTLSSAQATERAAHRQIQNARALSSGVFTDVAGRLAELRDIDLGETAVQVSTANVAYQSALQTTAKLRQLSLLDFLR
jgi:flagellar hook-associated protein 3 FlgL